MYYLVGNDKANGRKGWKVKSIQDGINDAAKFDLVSFAIHSEPAYNLTDEKTLVYMHNDPYWINRGYSNGYTRRKV